MIDPETQSRLRARFNPDGSDLRRLQMRMLQMLEYIDRVCSENNITYWLSSGTCLGAIRHGGFIPWDDDVDIEMLEADYRKFLRVMGSEPRDGYVLQSAKNEPTYILTHAKLRDLSTEIKELSPYDRSLKYRGVFVDIFHLSPSGSRRLHRFGAWVTRKAHRLAGSRAFGLVHRLIAATLFPLLGLLGHIGAGRQLRHEPGSMFSAPRRRDDLLPTVRLPFEGLMLPVPANADAYLRRIYGDYTTLPPLHSIRPHFSAFAE